MAAHVTRMPTVWTMMDRTLVLAKKDLREMEQFVLVNYNLKNICTFGLFSHLINFFSSIFHLFILFYFFASRSVCLLFCCLSSTRNIKSTGADDKTENCSFLIDIDECLSSKPCDENADCVNTDSSFICTCRQGFTGNGTTCNGKYCKVLFFELLIHDIKFLVF